MSKIYTKRSRVETVLMHQEADRVPCDLTISPPAYSQLCRHLGIKYEPYWWDDANHAFPSVECLEKLNVDVYHLPANCFTPKNFSPDLDEFRDQWGILRKKVVDAEGSFMYISIDNPLKGVETVEDVMNYAWPSADNLYDASKIEDIAKRLYNETDFALTAVFGGHLFEMPHFLIGLEDFLVLLYTDPEIPIALMKKTREIQMEVETKVLKSIGKYLTYIRLNGEDIGTQSGPLISPEVYTELVSPLHEVEWAHAKDEFRKYNPKGKLSIHTCGSVMPFIEPFISAGCEILNPVQSSAEGMDTRILGEKFTGRLAFHGAIDSQDVLVNGTKDDVRNEVRKRIMDLGQGGGYIAAPSHNIQFNTPCENVVTMYEAIQEFGKYPLEKY